MQTFWCSSCCLQPPLADCPEETFLAYLLAPLFFSSFYRKRRAHFFRIKSVPVFLQSFDYNSAFLVFSLCLLPTNQVSLHFKIYMEPRWFVGILLCTVEYLYIYELRSEFSLCLEEWAIFPHQLSGAFRHTWKYPEWFRYLLKVIQTEDLLHFLKYAFLQCVKNPSCNSCGDKMLSRTLPFCKTG